ncbi:MAG: TIGR02757 family protein [Vicinamibacteria bacterium]
MGSRLDALREKLEGLRLRYDARYLGSDPLEFPRRYRDPRDREVIGLIAASLAYGNVKAIRASLERILAWIGPHPADRVLRLSPRDALHELRGFRHRWTRDRDVACLVLFAGQMLDRRGSIGAFFSESYLEGDMAGSLRRFSERALSLDHGGLYRERKLPLRAGVRFFFPSPVTGAAKRLNMYLRWMARPDDGVDLGLWSFVPTRELVIPLDTHIFRIGSHLRWTSRKTPGFRAACDITKSLARFDPEDPVKYDFALSRLGILEGCPRHRKSRESGRCELCELGS